ncbi:hypothetical protein HHI36_007411 [Cryptolaemus montrouzieri]|uniref:Uncharacterized protein n=1 Tax=Cryptolaemus montrouzieri TaxID=559131 RepID=A0ABD2MPE5_9CUCU
MVRYLECTGPGPSASESDKFPAWSQCLEREKRQCATFTSLEDDRIPRNFNKTPGHCQNPSCNCCSKYIDARSFRNPDCKCCDQGVPDDLRCQCYGRIGDENYFSLCDRIITDQPVLTCKNAKWITNTNPIAETNGQVLCPKCYRTISCPLQLNHSSVAYDSNNQIEYSVQTCPNCKQVLSFYPYCHIPRCSCCGAQLPTNPFYVNVLSYPNPCVSCPIFDCQHNKKPEKLDKIVNCEPKKSTLLVGGVLRTRCDCFRRNGLQDECKKFDCVGPC